MSDFEKLKSMDIEEIHKKTYIARKNLKALLKKDFSKFDRLKALGFVKIIEREFGLDLSELKEEIRDYFDKKESKKEKIEEKVEEVKKVEDRESNKKNLLIGIIVVLIALFTIFFQSNKQSTSKSISKSIEKNETNVTKKEPITIVEKNLSSKEASKIDETNISQSSQSSLEENTTEKNQTIKKSLSIKKSTIPKITLIPKSKIWVGVIYLDNFRKKNYLTSLPIELNSSRDFLLLTGHGMLKIDIDSNITDYNSPKRLRFLYKDGNFTKIDEETFKEYNRGKNW